MTEIGRGAVDFYSPMACVQKLGKLFEFYSEVKGVRRNEKVFHHLSVININHRELYAVVTIFSLIICLLIVYEEECGVCLLIMLIFFRYILQNWSF